MFSQELREHRSGRLIERPLAGKTQYGRRRLPWSRKVWRIRNSFGRISFRHLPLIFGHNRRLRVVGRWIAIVVLCEFADQTIDRVPHLFELSVSDHAALGIVGGKLQTLERHLVVVGRQRALVEEKLGMALGLVGVACEYALVEALDRREGRPIT